MRLTPLERAQENYAYLTEVAEFWGTRDHECMTVLGFLCSACHEFYADIEAASIALDLAVAEECRKRTDARLLAEVAW